MSSPPTGHSKSPLRWLSAPLVTFNAVTLKAAARAIGPSGPPEGLDEHVLEELEAQLRAFPFWHRLGFRVGLVFLELGAPLGAWGLRPFSLLSRSKAGERFEAMMHSHAPGVRLFCHSLKVLVCLSVYGHPEVEARFGAPRRAWRASRVALHDALVMISEPKGYPAPPERSAHPQWLSEEAYLDEDAHLKLNLKLQASSIESAQADSSEEMNS